MFYDSAIVEHRTWKNCFHSWLNSSEQPRALSTKRGTRVQIARVCRSTRQKGAGCYTWFAPKQWFFNNSRCFRLLEKDLTFDWNKPLRGNTSHRCFVLYPVAFHNRKLRYIQVPYNGATNCSTHAVILWHLQQILTRLCKCEHLYAMNVLPKPC